MQNLLTPLVFEAAYSVCYLNDSRFEGFLSSLLSSYVQDHGDFLKDTASRMHQGKRKVPKPIARYYASVEWGAPTQLYTDIKQYYELVCSLTFKLKDELWVSLLEIVDNLPKADSQGMIEAVDTRKSTHDKVYLLLAILLDYAWCVDLAEYTYLPE